MQNRALPFAVITAAITAIAITALPWFNIGQLGMDISWNGLGIASVPDFGRAPNGRGWLIVAACAIAIITALAALLPSPAAKQFTRLMSALSAGAAALAALVPIIIWIWPSWYFGAFQEGLGLPHEVDLSINKAILGMLTAVLLLLAALCAGLFLERSEEAPAPKPARRTSAARGAGR